MKAVKLLEDSGVPQEALKKEKTEVYEQLSEVNRKIRAEREKLELCREICQQTPVMAVSYTHLDVYKRQPQWWPEHEDHRALENALLKTRTLASKKG